MPQALILAGPNGAGKTTFANEFFALVEGLHFVNADEFRRHPSLAELPDEQRDFRAGRLMLSAIDRLVGQRADFMVETTLAS